MPQTFLLLPIFRPVLVERCWEGKNNVVLTNVAINFGYEYFCSVIHFSNIFFLKTFFEIFFFLTQARTKFDFTIRNQRRLSQIFLHSTYSHDEKVRC